MPHCIKILSLIISKPSPLEQPSVKTFPACGPLKTFPARRPQDLNSSLRTAALYTGVKTFPVCMAVQCRNSYIGRGSLLRRPCAGVVRLRIGRDAEFWRGEDDGGCECIRIESCPKEVFSGNGIIDATTPTRVKVAKRDKRGAGGAKRKKEL